MVDGHEALRPLLAVDLDGTYLRGNSLHLYLRRAMAWHLRRGAWWRTAAIAGLIGLRRLRLLSHVDMKFPALRIAGRSNGLLADFGRRASAMVSPEVTAYIEQLRAQGWEVLLASAAADFYIPQIWSGPFVATAMDRNRERRECRGQEKVRRVQGWCERHGCRLQGVVTDHTDDLPLLRATPTRQYNRMADPTTGKLSPA